MNLWINAKFLLSVNDVIRFVLFLYLSRLFKTPNTFCYSSKESVLQLLNIRRNVLLIRFIFTVRQPAVYRMYVI